MPGGNVTDNTLVWRKFTFTPVTTNKIRVVFTRTTAVVAYLTEIEAWTNEASNVASVHWLVTDQLGTPRMVFDQSGSLANVSRHDYLPFGEELYAGTGGRSSASGYTGDPTRQHFTGQERDSETGLDYFHARYLSSTQGRFTSVDPYNPIIEIAEREKLNAYFGQPQNWNRYAYVLNNPLLYNDPNGEKLALSGNLEEAKAELCQMLGQGCKDDGANITYDAKTNTLTVDLSGIDLNENEGAKLISDLVSSDHQYTFGVGSQYETQAGTVKFQTTESNLPPFKDQIQGPKQSPPAGTDDLVVVNPGAQRSADDNCKCPDMEIAPLWGIAFHELAEAYAKIDHGKTTYAAGHAEAKERERMLRRQRPALIKYLPFSGERQAVHIRQ